MLVSTTGTDNCHTARHNKIKYYNNKHASFTKNTYNIKSTHTQKQN